MNGVNSRCDFDFHDDSTVNIDLSIYITLEYCYCDCYSYCRPDACLPVSGHC